MARSPQTAQMERVVFFDSFTRCELLPSGELSARLYT
jgi:hypothetical protein